jgi:hypothetical protein
VSRMTQLGESKDTSKCPLCGRDNDCAVAAGRDVGSCWCMTASINPTALGSIPAEARGKVCICARCASGAPAG